jgi:hypothetical protein
MASFSVPPLPAELLRGAATVPQEYPAEILARSESDSHRDIRDTPLPAQQKLASSAEPVGKLRLRKRAKIMI